MAYEGSRQVGFMRQLFQERPWHKMVPDQAVLASEGSSGPFRLAAARVADGSFAIAYTPVGQPLSIALNKLSGPQVKAQWYDPRNGTWQPAGQHPAQGVGKFAPPSGGAKEDWALVLDSAR